MRSLAVHLALIACALVGAPVPAADCAADEAGRPRVLVLALDGIPLRSVEQARARGAFDGWPEPRALVSTFPSVTNVAFTAIFSPLGVDTAGGYEVAHFDLERNEVVGGTPFGYEERLFAWRDAFDVTSRTIGSKLETYTRPKKVSHEAVDKAETLLLQTCKSPVLAHVGATDALFHLRGDKAVLKFLLELDRRVGEIRLRYETASGRALRVVLLSDHGNSSIKIHKSKGIRKALRRADLEVVKHLERPGTVVAPTFGIVGYGALFMHQQDAATAARATVANRSVDLAAWLADPREMRVVSDAGQAVVQWRPGAAGGWELAYVCQDGDPLGYRAVVERLRETGRLGPDGFAAEDDWFRETVATEYPDGPRRLIHSLTGTYVENYATVIFSLKPGYAWGWTSAHLGSLLSGGRLEGTHGGLDAASTLGFFMADAPELQPDGPLRADQALVGLVDPRETAAFPADGGSHPPGM